ncbi:hypothetical protein C4K88_15860 [Arthrobacter pityocampae]|uniref:Uncharacterized protein n=1 Tax=Arthrobacter pityocampae TaxID=547334 RepID=A0A2S5ITP2_9MICC|nr:hypothetical protein [Arthrobacter pityocampae]PPB47944.1 hypothetical protein C4K88_15860 [Arthrobacter pityocampae]
MTESTNAGHPDGRPARDRREEILEPGPGAAGHQASSIRDEQGTHEAGAVPAAFDGDDTFDGDDPTSGPDGADRPRRPEDAASGHDTWDGGLADR